MLISMQICPKLKAAMKKYSEKHGCKIVEKDGSISLTACKKEFFECPYEKKKKKVITHGEHYAQSFGVK